MTTIEKNRVLIDADASDLAFAAGQALEKCLIDAGVREAQSRAQCTVTSEMIAACLSVLSLSELQGQLDEGTPDDGESRAAA